MKVQLYPDHLQIFFRVNKIKIFPSLSLSPLPLLLEGNIMEEYRDDVGQAPRMRLYIENILNKRYLFRFGGFFK